MIFFQAGWLSNFAVAVSEIRPSNDNPPHNNPNFAVCHQHEGYPIDPITINCEPGPRWGRYVSVYLSENRPLNLCEFEVYGAQCKYVSHFVDVSHVKLIKYYTYRSYAQPNTPSPKKNKTKNKTK